jgi:hypothetical protein
VFKKFILGSLLVAGLTACPNVDPPIDPPIVNPKAIADTIEFTLSQSIKPAINDVKGTADLVDSTIDLDVNTPNQQTFWDDVNKLGRFTLDPKTGFVTFKPATGKSGNGAVASYRIKDSSGHESNIAKINVTVTPVATGPIKVLFIGNSRTWYEPCTSGFASYDIPSMVQSMAVGEARKLEVKVVTNCGQTLAGHFSNTVPPTEARVQIATKGWEYVVLQAATNETDTGAQTSTRSLIQQYKSAVTATNPNARIILYENWSLLNASGDQSRLTSFYQLAADDVGAKIAPVGRAWRQGNFSEAQLFNADGEGKHATTLGAYIAASTFYSLFYGKQAPSSIGIPSGLLSSDASIARANAYSAYSSASMSKYR